MIYDVRVDGWRPFSVSERQVMCKHASTLGYGKYLARPGYWINFTTAGDQNTQQRIGRVLGRIEAPTDVCGWIYVLALSLDGTYLQPLWVNPDWVHGVQDETRVPAALLAWFTQPTLPSPDLVAQLAGYGSLSVSYIEQVADRQRAFEHGVSPQGYEALLKADPATWPKPFLYARLKVSRRRIADLIEDQRAAKAAGHVAELTTINIALRDARDYHRDLFRLLKVPARETAVPPAADPAGTVETHG